MTEFPYPECDPGTVLEENKRYFGEYDCENCARWWKSGNSWLGFGQNCSGCGELTFPGKLSYLQAPPADTNDIEKRHPQEKCERCRRLGHYCRDSENLKLKHNRRERTNRNNRAESSAPVRRQTRFYSTETSVRSNSIMRQSNTTTSQTRAYSVTPAITGPSRSQNQQNSTSISNYPTLYQTSSSTVYSDHTSSSSYNANSFSNNGYDNYRENAPEFRTRNSYSNPYPRHHDINFNCVNVFFFVFWLLIFYGIYCLFKPVFGA